MAGGRKLLLGICALFLLVTGFVGCTVQSQLVTWTCVGSPCPWGPTNTAQAIVWPASMQPTSARLGYMADAGVYLPAANANGMTVAVRSGTANVYAGAPDAPEHRLLATITPAQSYKIRGVLLGEVVSVQSDASFSYETTPAGPGDADAGPGPGDTVASVPALWRCNIPECTSPDWTGAVITWPSWSAYQSNGRSGDQSRSVFSPDGQALYPYMGSWAEGCQVTAVSGTVVVIEWERGTDVWRETWLAPAESHVIHLTAPENGAMIEASDGSPGFSVSLQNCAPRLLP